MPARTARGREPAVGVGDLVKSCDVVKGRDVGKGRGVRKGSDVGKSMAAEAGPQAEAPPAAAEPGSRGRGRWVALGVVAVIAAGTVAAWRTGVFSPAAASGTGPPGVPPPAMATVTRQHLSATTPVTATLGYAGSYAVTGQGSGTLTWLPSAGQLISQGQALYKT